MIMGEAAIWVIGSKSAIGSNLRFLIVAGNIA